MNLGAFVVADIASGFNHTCAINTEGRVKCWGLNTAGALGLGDVVARGDQSADMGNALPVVDVGSGVTASALDIGYFHACAITSLGLKCWGDGRAGALGYGDTADRGDGVNEMGDQLPVVDLGAPVLQVGCGDGITCALVMGGAVKCWGENSAGELGIGDTNDRGDQIGEMGTALPRVPLPEPAQQIFVGAVHACAILASGSLACWGNDTLGSLGAGSTESIGDQPGEPAVIHTVASLWP